MFKEIGWSLLLFVCVECVLYDRYSGEKLNEKQTADYDTRNLTGLCTIDVKACTPHEGSRIDGTCSNLKHPTRGSAITPFIRLLPPDFSKNVGLRVARDGSDLPLARKVRTTLLNDGRVVSKNFNTAALHYAEFFAGEVVITNGIIDYLRTRQYCCEPAGNADPRCAPIIVPDDDPYLKVTDIRCMNFTRADTFQFLQCIPDTIPPEAVNYQTPILDLSLIYGINEDISKTVREMKGGLLKMEVRNGRYLPLGDAGPACFGNMPNETICYRFGNPPVGNFDVKAATFVIFLFREHNRIAKILSEMNPCWSDDRLFRVARQINIATTNNILYYELMPLLLGYKNMVQYGVISDRVEHLREFDEDGEPNMFAEFGIAYRYFHTMNEDRIVKYDKDYKPTYELSLSDTIFRTAVIEDGQNFEEINRATFNQPCSAIDNNYDPKMTETMFGAFFKASDLIAIDIQRGRDFGLRGYNEYRELCGLRRAKTFDDFYDTIDVSKVDRMRQLYTHVDDVDLYVGIALENFIEDGFVGPTLFCIMAKQLRVLRTTDRFWFERGDNPHSLTLPQLYEIRKTTIARFACDNVKEIKYIQPQAFVNIGKNNQPVPCEHLPSLDLSKWEDPSCQKDSHKQYEL